MSDLISRQAAINALRQEVILCKLSLESPFLNAQEKKDLQIRKAQAIDDIVAIEGLPSAERRGRWIMHIDDLFPEESTMECDQCHEEQPLTCDDKYCPNCGARMEAGE